MENDIDTNTYYAFYHIKGWFDCCWMTPRLKIPKDVGRLYLKGIDNTSVIQELVAESKGFCVDPEDVEILEVRRINK
jgi:hypothetical protein